MTTRTMEAPAANRPDPIEDAKVWLRNSTGAGPTATVIRRLVLYAEKLLRDNQKAQARVRELEEHAGSAEEFEQHEHGT